MDDLQVAMCRVASSSGKTEDDSGSERMPHQTSSGGQASVSQTAPEQVTARLLVDCMGHWSPIVRQMRGSKKPEGMCLVVGGCASGVPEQDNR